MPESQTALSQTQASDERAHLKANLEQFLTSKDAEQLAQLIDARVAEVDAEVDRLLRDPLVMEAWDYDGRCFVSRGDGFGLQVVFDGLNILQWLNTNLDCFFRSNSAPLAVALLFKELDTFLWLARVRRMNWEEQGHLSVLTREVISAVMTDVQERRSATLESAVPPLTESERSFFQPYEEEIKSVGVDEA